MKIKCDREKLLAAFQTAASVVPSRSPKPILQNVKIDVAEETACLMATDMEMGIRTAVDGVQTEVSGNALLSVAQFGSILRESNAETLNIEADGHGVVVSGDNFSFKLASGNPAEFPDVADFAEDKYHEVSARLMKELIRRTLFATDTESSRYALGGVLLEMDEDKIVAVGTDGRRLAKMEGPAVSVGGHVTGDAMTIVPSRSMQLIERALSEADAEIQVASHGNEFFVKSPKATITSRLVEGRFPRWRDVLPDRPEAATVEIAVGPFHSALRQAAIVVSADSRGIDFTFGHGTLLMCGLTADIGESRIEIPIPYEGSEITLRMDHRYVSDFLKVLDPEKSFTLNIVDSDSAALCLTDDGYGYVVMPLARTAPFVGRGGNSGIGVGRCYFGLLMSFSKRYKAKLVEPQRREPRKLGDVLPQLMARRGYNRLISQENFHEAWKSIAGPLYQHSRPGQIRRGVLEIVAANSTILQELTFQKRRLISALSEKLPDQKISDLRFVVGKID